MPAGSIALLDFYFLPPHNQLNEDGLNDISQKRIDLAFILDETNVAPTSEEHVDLLYLELAETPVADLPSGWKYLNLAAKEPLYDNEELSVSGLPPNPLVSETPWPALHIPRLHPDYPPAYIRTINNAAASTHAFNYWNVDHSVFYNHATKSWNLIGIHNSPGSRFAVTQDNTKAFESGLVIVRGEPEKPFFNRSGDGERLAFAPARLELGSSGLLETAHIIADMDRPAPYSSPHEFFFGYWAPFITSRPAAEGGRKYYMFPTEHRLTSDSPSKFRGIRRWESTLPDIAAGWKAPSSATPIMYNGSLFNRNTGDIRDPRDIHMATIGTDRTHAVWAGYMDNGSNSLTSVVMARKYNTIDPGELVASNPSEEKPVFKAYSPASMPRFISEPAYPPGGELSENESPALFFDASRKVYDPVGAYATKGVAYLKTTRNAIRPLAYPNSEAYLALDKANKKILYINYDTRDVSQFLPSSYSFEGEASIVGPIALVPLEPSLIGADGKNQKTGMVYVTKEGYTLRRQRILVLDVDPAGNYALVEVDLTNGKAHPYRATGSNTLVEPSELARWEKRVGNANVVRVLVADQMGDQNPEILLLSGPEARSVSFPTRGPDQQVLLMDLGQGGKGNARHARRGSVKVSTLDDRSYSNLRALTIDNESGLCYYAVDIPAEGTTEVHTLSLEQLAAGASSEPSILSLPGLPSDVAIVDMQYVMDLGERFLYLIDGTGNGYKYHLQGSALHHFSIPPGATMIEDLGDRLVIATPEAFASFNRNMEISNGEPVGAPPFTLIDYNLRGHALRSPSALVHLVTTRDEKNIYGSDVYWSYLKPTTDGETQGDLQPFRSDRKIGWFPYYAMELHHDHIEPSADQWLGTYTGEDIQGGYGVSRLRWTLPAAQAE